MIRMKYFLPKQMIPEKPKFIGQDKEKGEKGDKGDKGDQGEKGEKGETGPPCETLPFTGFHCDYVDLPLYTKDCIGYTMQIVQDEDHFTLHPTVTKHTLVGFQVPAIGVWLLQINISLDKYVSVPYMHYCTIDTLLIPMNFPVHRVSDFEYLCSSTVVLPVTSLSPWYDLVYCSQCEEQTIHATTTLLATRIG
jgi:hypothetical protein